MINISIDLNKIDKSKIKSHANGAKYYNITVDERKEPDQFGNTHTVYEQQTKEERAAKEGKKYIGSGKEFKFNGGTASNNNVTASNANVAPVQSSQPIDDLPF
jgi:hypothetical protein